jgi:DNA-binding SARP family transcriptional activator
VEFGILGPLAIVAGPGRVEVANGRQQVVMATLLLSPGRVVTIDRLVEAVYGADLPATPRTQAQIGISSLRRLLAVHGLPGIISTHPQGYVMHVGDGDLDSVRFEELVVAAGAARDAGQPDAAIAAYRDALRLWRGPALESLDSQLLRVAAGRLDEQRIAVNEERLSLELDQGRHFELAGELAGLVREFPLRERLRGQLMLALYRCGRTAEALEVYRDTRRVMVDELGIEPGERLRRLQHAILAADFVA